MEQLAFLGVLVVMIVAVALRGYRHVRPAPGDQAETVGYIATINRRNEIESEAEVRNGPYLYVGPMRDSEGREFVYQKRALRYRKD